MKINEKIILALLFTAMVGICAGAFFEVYMTGEIKNRLSDMLSAYLNATGESTEDVSFSSCFFNGVRINLPLIAVTLISPFIIITLPLLPLLILVKGIAAGFAAAMTIETMGLPGIFKILLHLLPQNLLQIPAYCFMAALALQAGVVHASSLVFHSSPSVRRKRKTLHTYARLFFLYYFICAAVIILSCLLEAFLLQLRI